LNGGTVRRHRRDGRRCGRFSLICLRAGHVTLFDQRRVAGGITLGARSHRLIFRKLRPRLVQHRDIWTRIDLEQHLASLHRLPFRKSDAIQNPVHLRFDGHRLHRLRYAIGGNDIRHRDAFYSGDTDGNRRLAGRVFLGAGGTREENESRNARGLGARAHLLAGL